MPPFGRVIREAGADRRVDQDLAVSRGRAADERGARVAGAGRFPIAGVHDGAQIGFDAVCRYQREVDGGASRMGGDFRRRDLVVREFVQGFVGRWRSVRRRCATWAVKESRCSASGRWPSFTSRRRPAGSVCEAGVGQPFGDAAAHLQDMRARVVDAGAAQVDGDAVVEGSEIDAPLVRLLPGDRPDGGIGERNHGSGQVARTVAGRWPMSIRGAVVLVGPIANMPESGGRRGAV